MPWASKYVPFIGTRWTCSKFGPWLIVCLENGIGASPVCWQASALLREPAPSPSASRVRHSLCGRMQRASLQASPQATTIGTLSPLTHSPRLVTAVIAERAALGIDLGLSFPWKAGLAPLPYAAGERTLREPAPSPLASRARHGPCGRMQRASPQATIGTLSPLTHSPRLVTAVICRACCARSSTLVGRFLGKRDWRLSRMLQASFLREPTPSPSASRARHGPCGRMQRASPQATIGTLSPLTHSPRLVTAVICRACCARSSTLVGRFLGKRDWRLSRMLQASFLREPTPSPSASRARHGPCGRMQRASPQATIGGP